MPDSQGNIRGISLNRLYPGHRDYQPEEPRKRFRCLVDGCDYSFQSTGNVGRPGPFCPEHFSLLRLETIPEAV